MRYAVDFYLQNDKIMTAVLRDEPQGVQRLFVYHAPISVLQDKQRERESFRDYIFDAFGVLTLDRIEHNPPYTVYFEASRGQEGKTNWFNSLRRLRSNGYIEIRPQEPDMFRGIL